ncbi:hypothetical protein AOQ84DRAFT_381052 [Glonium stellatum]|uniref:Clr5 domain-containing protein n=1 Tax=Glonium stellatum TaxID=574774 RepID=A0A8E2ESX1_9PEZI|nr:hypothetical protein AOQ84DRAFT_381052 [Glonium stellatum]
MTKDWDTVWQHIRDLYVVQEKPLKEVREIIRLEHGFYAHERSYRLKLHEWGFKRRTAATASTLVYLKRPSSPISGVATLQRLSSTNHISKRHRDTSPISPHTEDQSISSLSPNFRDDSARGSIFETAVSAIHKGDLSKLEELLGPPPNRLLIGPPISSPSSDFAQAHSHNIHRLLDMASSLPYADVVRLLIKYEVAPTYSLESHHSSALLNAIQNDRPMNVDVLLSAGASAKGTAEGYIPLQHAVSYLVSPSIFQMLLGHGANINTFCLEDGIAQSMFQIFLHNRSSLLRPLKKHGYVEKVLKVLLEFRADISAVDYQGRRPFEIFLDPWRSKAKWFSVMTPEERSCLALFLSNGARIQTPFQSPLCSQDTSPTFEHIILCHTDPKTVSLLINHVDTGPGGNGSNVLNELLKSCSDKSTSSELNACIIQKILEKGADPNGLDDEGHSPLINLLSSRKNIQIYNYICCLNMLLGNGADPRRVDSKGQYPLDFIIHNFDTRDPLRLQLAELLLLSYTRQSGDWTEPYFPITPNWLDYIEGSNFWNDAHANQSEELSEFFTRATLSVSTKMFLDHETSIIPSLISNLDVLEALKIRKASRLPDYEISQDYTICLLEMYKSSFTDTWPAKGSLTGPTRQPGAPPQLATNKSLALPDASIRMGEDFWLSAVVPATLQQNPLKPPPPGPIQSGIFQEIDQAYMCPICPQFPGVILEGWQYR